MPLCTPNDANTYLCEYFPFQTFNNHSQQVKSLYKDLYKTVAITKNNYKLIRSHTCKKLSLNYCKLI